ncbi:MAG: GNAT family N-acetyltransferase [Kofleriaceae bacterium]|nr:GNAT family N-acetyltransferase [Kofleriaceae bacterium]
MAALSSPNSESSSVASAAITRIRFAAPADVPAIYGFICALADYEKLRHCVVATEASLLAQLFGPRPAAEVLIAERVVVRVGPAAVSDTGPDAVNGAGHGAAASPGAATVEHATTVGFALFFHSFSTFLAQPGLYLEDLFVDPAARSLGIGSALMAALARIAVDRGCGRFEWSVLDWNAPALKFYRALGSESQSEWTVERVTGQALANLAAKHASPLG